MNILWFTWKDSSHPAAGGAEHVNEELAKRAVQDGHNVIFLVGGYKGSKRLETRDGYSIVRLGNKFTVYIHACAYFLKHLQNWPDIIVEEVNTMPFMTQFYSRKKRVLIFHQLCREIWFYQFFFPLNLVGFLIEPLYVWLLRNNTVVTISESTRQDLQHYGFKRKNIHIIPMAYDIKPVKNLSYKKYKDWTVLSLGSIRPMKRTLHQIRAFEIARKNIPHLKMILAGDIEGNYGKRVLDTIKKSPYKKDINYLGRVSQTEKKELMKAAHVLLVTSVKEGWGLVITEAGTQGTPSIVYNVDGLRDSAHHNISGLVCEKNTPDELAHLITFLYSDSLLYEKLRMNALSMNAKLNFDDSYRKFRSILNKV